MNILLQQLAQTVEKYPWQEKLLVVPSRHYGYQLMEGLARQGTPWLNVRPVTPLGLALEIAGDDLARRGLQATTYYQSVELLNAIIAAMTARGDLIYFKTINEAGLLSSLLLHSIRDLRLAGLKTENIDPGAFANPQKGREMKAIFNQYDLGLEASHLVDEAEIYERAEALVPDELDALAARLLLIPEQMELSTASERFLRHFQAASLVLAGDPVVGLNNPGAKRFTPASSPPPESGLSYIFEPAANRLAVDDIEIFPAYGEACEVREVLRRIKHDGAALDQVKVVMSRNQPYLALLYDETLRLQLPVTWARGVPVTYTRPGRLLSGILEWINSNYPIKIIYRLLTGGDLEVFPALEAAQLLRDSRILWGRNRSLKRLAELSAELQEELDRAIDSDSPRIAFWSGRLFACKQLRIAMEKIIGWIDSAQVDDRTDMNRLCDGLAAIIKSYAPVRNESDKAGQQVIIDELNRLGAANPAAVKTGTAIRILQQVLGGLSAEAGGPRPGHLYVCGVDDALWCSRPATYLLGMDAVKIEGRTFQDPVLLDCEREQLSPSLHLQRGQQQQRLYRIASLLASCRGPLTVSFPSCDGLDGRPSAPSSLLLHIYRVLSGQPEADYSQLLNSLPPAAVYVPHHADAAIDERGWWLAQAFSPATGGLNQSEVAACFPALEDGLAAAAQRGSSLFTEYDGKISAGRQLDPRHNRAQVLSASAIETMAKCPFMYFLRYVLRIEIPEDMTIDNSAWLDALQRGSLLHSIYSGYQDEVYGPGKSRQPDKQLLLDIAEREIDALRQQVPPPDQLIFRLEKEELLRGLEVYFYLLEEKHSAGGALPVYSEVPFGMGAAEVQAVGMGLAEPAEIKLPGGGSFQLRGWIDLVEREPDSGRYQIWDYKTGSTWGYNDQGFCKGGQQVQHLLYSIAAEQILGALPGQTPVQVDRAGYLFPTDKGEGRIIARCQSRRGHGLEAVEKVLDLMGQGVFCSSSATTYCNFCDYKCVCRSEQAVQMLNHKLTNAVNTCLDDWKELQQYD